MAQPSGLLVGLATLDVIQFVAAVPAANQKLDAEASWLAAGGPAANAAIAFAALGGRATLWTALGTGPAADLVRADLAGAGVRVVDAAPSGFGLAPSSVLVQAGTGERAVVSGSGHRPDQLRVDSFEADASQVVLLDGHHPPLALAAARAARAVGTPVVLDAGSAKPVFADLLPLADDVICSADYRDPHGRTAADLLALGPGLVATSHGGDALEWLSATGAGRVRPPRVAVRDTLGAGDVLHGAHAYARAAGADGPTALEFGVRAASLRVQHLGPFAWRTALAASAVDLRQVAGVAV